MTRYSPGGGAGTCPLVPGSRASTTLGGEGCHSLAATPRETEILDARAMSPASPASPARVVTGLAGGEPGRGSVVSPGLVRISGTRRRGAERSPAFAVEANVLSGASRVVRVIPRVGVGESLHPRARCQPATGANQRGAGTGPVQHAMRGSSYEVWWVGETRF